MRCPSSLVGDTLCRPLSAAAAAETSTKACMGKAEEPEPGMEKAAVTKAEAPEPGMEKAGVTKTEARKPGMEKGPAEAAVKAAAKPDRNSDRPSPPPRITPAPWIAIGPVWGIIGVVIRVWVGAALPAGGC